MEMKIVPITIKEANGVVGEHHRHSNPTHGGKWAIGCEHDGKLVGACIVGRPIARLLDTNKTAEVTRLVTTPDAPSNTCSFLYSAARRVWSAMGGHKILTYTLQKESGASLKGAGWTEAARVSGGQWNRANRNRKKLEIYNQPKIRWEATCPSNTDARQAVLKSEAAWK
jgi:hypothetical protein